MRRTSGGQIDILRKVLSSASTRRWWGASIVAVAVRM
jgi:hypothetical protein